jgi:hypothetical protein
MERACRSMADSMHKVHRDYKYAEQRRDEVVVVERDSGV